MAAYQDRSCEGIPGQSPRLKGRGHDIEEIEHDYIGLDVMISEVVRGKNTEVASWQ